jgi:hypothetical protein
MGIIDIFTPKKPHNEKDSKNESNEGYGNGGKAGNNDKDSDDREKERGLGIQTVERNSYNKK